MANINQLPNELIAFIIQLVVNEPDQYKYSTVSVPVNTRFDYIASTKSLRWKQINKRVVLSIRLICKRIQIVFDGMFFENLAYTHLDQYYNDLFFLNDRSMDFDTYLMNYSFNFYDDLISICRVPYYRAEFINNRFKDRFFRVDKKQNIIPRQLFLSQSINNVYQPNFSSLACVKHLFLVFSSSKGRDITRFFFHNRSLLDFHPSLKEITLEIFGSAEIDHDVLENLRHCASKNSTQFHLILRTVRYKRFLEFLHLKDSIKSLTLDFLNLEETGSDVHMNFIADQCPKLKTLALGGIFNSFERMETILSLSSLEELVLPISVYVRMSDPSIFAIVPTLKRLTIDFYDFIMALKSEQVFDSLTHLQVIVQPQFKRSYQNIYDIFFDAANDASINELTTIISSPGVFHLKNLECLELYCKTNIFGNPSYGDIVIESVGRLVKDSNVKLFTLQMNRSEFSSELMHYLDSVEELNVVDMDSSSLVPFQIEIIFQRPLQNLRQVTFSLFSTYFSEIIDLFLGDFVFLVNFPMLESVTGLFEHFANDDAILLQNSSNHVFRKIEASMVDSKWQKNFSLDEVKSFFEIVLYDNVVTIDHKQLLYKGSVRSMQDVHPVCFLINFNKVRKNLELRNIDIVKRAYNLS